jgi:hypothetical protein
MKDELVLGSLVYGAPNWTILLRRLALNRSLRDGAVYHLIRASRSLYLFTCVYWRGWHATIYYGVVTKRI